MRTPILAFGSSDEIKSSPEYSHHHQRGMAVQVIYSKRHLNTIFGGRHCEDAEKLLIDLRRHVQAGT